MKTLATRLRAVRLKAKLSQRALEELCGLPSSYVSQVEHGRREPNALNLSKLAGALGCRVDDLLPPVRIKR